MHFRLFIWLEARIHVVIVTVILRNTSFCLSVYKITHSFKKRFKKVINKLNIYFIQTVLHVVYCSFYQGQKQ